MKNKVLIFGSTGSIGKNVLSVIRASKNKFKVIGLCANKDSDTLYRQIKEFKPLFVCLRDEDKAKSFKKKLDKSIKFFFGQKGLEEFSSIKADIAVMAITGISALKPLLIAIANSKRIALANKESIVTAGSIVFNKAKSFNTQILPVDSEINALFQLIKPSPSSDLSRSRFKRRGQDDFRKVYLTASGGALAGYSKSRLAQVSVDKVLDHPTWKMGKRVTVDSATLVNKGFEVIETHCFFGLDYSQIGIVLHKESAIHAFVECRDNTLFACLYPPDMKMPISYALYYPKRFNSQKEVNFKSSFSCNFKPLDYKDYPLLKIILQAGERGDNALVVLNAVDEIAIDYFLKRKIKFIDIHKVMTYFFRKYESSKIKKIEDVFFWDDWARNKTKEYLNKL
ncbi:MAG: 1-deoxy-D-xylulose-5-phosphate reductoisomerase [Candidatus Susulua stagnicola]|nr:1-deoxy-D-xylulose-5-phosphate reductoisomerase [Candidatus Susulua stagnicola]